MCLPPVEQLSPPEASRKLAPVANDGDENDDDDVHDSHKDVANGFGVVKISLALHVVQFTTWLLARALDKWRTAKGQ